MQIRLTAGSLPPNTCLESLQDFYNLMFSRGYGTLDTTASIAKVIVSATEPNADQRDYIWMRLNPITGAFDRVYNYISGKWVSPHADEPSSGKRILFVGSTADINRLDGGSNGTVGEASGPFWEIDTTFATRFPIGAGTLEDGTVIAGSGGSTGGNQTVAITMDNLPEETLEVSLPIIGQGSVGTSGEPVIGSDYGSTTVAGSGKAVDSTSTDLSSRYKPSGETEELGEGDELNILPPYIGVYFLKRTARRYHTPS